MPQKLDWSQVFNTNLKHWGHRDLAIEGAKVAGYKFLTWNGNILWLDGTDTGLTVDSLKKD